MRAFETYIDKNHTFEEVIVEKGGKVEFDTNESKLYLSDTALITLRANFETAVKKNKQEVQIVLSNSLHELFPKKFSKPKKAAYTPNAFANSINSWGNDLDSLSNDDKQAIKDLFQRLSMKEGFLSDSSLAKTKEIIDSKYLQKTLKEIKKLMTTTASGAATEKKWQQFLRTNSWIFSSLFAQPVILYQDEAFVGGKRIDNTNGKVTDFLILNSLSNNVSFLEIKTHKTQLLEKTAYRGDDVFSPTKDLSGSIVQVLNQRDNFEKEYYANIGKSRKGKKKEETPTYETFNSRCVVLCGSIKDLSPNQKYAFELFRSNSRAVDILTFDELEAKISSLQSLIK